MPVFSVNVSRTTRRGSSETLVSRVVDAGDSNVNEVKGFFEGQYKGLSVDVKLVEVVPVKVPVDEEMREEKRIVQYLDNVELPLNGHFAELYEAANAAHREYESAEEELVTSIREAYKANAAVGSVGTIAIRYGYARARIGRIVLRYPVFMEQALMGAVPATDPRD